VISPLPPEPAIHQQALVNHGTATVDAGCRVTKDLARAVRAIADRTMREESGRVGD